MRASYVVLEKAAVIKASQDTSNTANNKERYVIYFFVAPEQGEPKVVYRAIVDYDETTEETRIMILAFDKYIQDKKVLIPGEKEKPLPSTLNLDVDIAYGYENVSLSTINTDKNIKNILGQIDTKYSKLTKGKTLEFIEVLELKSGKLNYKIIYIDPVTHLTVKFVVYYNPKFEKVLLLNPVSLPNSQQFEELTDEQKENDEILKDILKYLKRLHREEMSGYKLQCISKGLIQENVFEYHVTWTTNGVQYRAFVRSYSGIFRETSFGELETISLDHYRLDDFEKLMITNYQRIDDSELKIDTNFDIAYQYLLNNNADARGAELIGASQKPLSLGFVYHIFMRNSNGIIWRAEVYLESYTLKVTIKNVKGEDFKNGLVSLNREDSSVKKVIQIIEKQANKPSLKNNAYIVQSVQGKDFLFGKLFVVTFEVARKNYVAIVYHDQSSEEALMVNWGDDTKPAGCKNFNDGGKCAQCIEGYTPINEICAFGCGILCKTVKF